MMLRRCLPAALLLAIPTAGADTQRPNPASDSPALSASALPTARVIAFPPLDPSRLAEFESRPGPLRIGLGRDLPAGDASRAMRPDHPRDPSQPGTLRIIAPGALALRLAIQAVGLPDGAVTRISGPGLQDAAVLSGAEINASLRADRDSGANAGDLGPVVWSPLVLGDTVTLQVELPEGAAAGSPRIRVPRISHVFRLPFLEPDPADGCHEDPACHPGWETASRATALLLHTDLAGATSVCTGTLIQDADPATRIPYLLTAHHCCSDQPRASSIEALWLRRPGGCAGPVAGFEAVSGGAELLHTDKTTDTTLLRLRRPAPTGAAFAPWAAELPAEGQAVVGVHHPGGGSQAIVFGEVVEHLNCDDILHCGDGSDPDGTHYMRVQWDGGTTLPGSSGSGLFLPDGRLVGVLSGGFGDCSRPGGPDDYGRVDLAHKAALHRWLGPSR